MSAPEHGTPEFWAQSRPDAAAVIHGDAMLTYGEWNDRADRVACRRLLDIGIPPASGSNDRTKLW
jgi:non-ribosomal peptide synthetase component F